MHLNKFLDFYLQLGINSSDSDFHKRRIKFVNIGFTIILLLLISLAITDYILQVEQVMLFHAIRISSILVSIFLLYKHKYFASIYFSLILFYFATIWGSVSMTTSNLFPETLFPLCVISFYLTNKKKLNVYFFILCAISYIALNYFNLHKPNTFSIGNIIATLVIFSVLYLVLLLFIIEHRYYKNIISNKNDILELKNNELQIQKESLESLNKLNNQLFSIIGHDLKNPANNVLGFSQLLLLNYDKYDNEKIKHFLQVIHTSTKQNIDLLDNLLNWAKSQTNKLEVKMSEVTLNSICKTLKGNFEIDLDKKNITIENNCNMNVSIFTDEIILTTILRNLFYNAIKFSPQDSIISVSSIESETNIEISISDHGLGMTTDMIKNFQNNIPNSSTLGTNKENGSGLGLMLCKELAEKINAEISIESELNKGTTIRLRIPKNI